MIRLYIENFHKNEVFELSRKQAHYLVNVMRTKNNEKIIVFNEKIGEFEAIFQKKGDFVYFATEGKIRDPVIRSREIHLAFSPVRPHLTHLIIEKITELGGTHIHPVIMDRTQNRTINAEKLKKIAIEASEQSERLDIPEILSAKSFLDFTENLKVALWLSAVERIEAPPILEEIKKIKLNRLPSKPISSSNEKIEKIGVIIGPEGGFSEKEKNILVNKTICISLGPLILRTETAAICAITCLVQGLQDAIN